MFWLLGSGAIAGLLLMAGVALRVIGARRWADSIRTHTGRLESARVDGRDRLPCPARYDAHELDGLPAPVQRYFRAVLTDGQAVIAAATIELAGTINMSTSSVSSRSAPASCGMPG